MQTKIQGHTSRSWNSVAGDMAVLLTAVLFRFVGSLFFQMSPRFLFIFLNTVRDNDRSKVIIPEVQLI